MEHGETEPWMIYQLNVIAVKNAWLPVVKEVEMLNACIVNVTYTRAQ